MKKINFIIGNSDELLNMKTIKKCYMNAHQFYDKGISKKKYIEKIIIESANFISNKKEIYIEAYNMQRNDYYLVIEGIKKIISNVSINADVYLNEKISLNKVSFPTIFDGFDNVTINGEGKELIDSLLVSPYQGYGLYYQGLLNNHKVLLQENYGYADYHNLRAINNKSKFRLASVSKQFIAYGILKLIDDKKIDFETKLYDLFNDLPYYTKEITIKMLLQHTSGLPDYETITECNGQLSDYDVLDFVRESNKPLFTPGKKYKYSNTGYVILGLIIEKVSYMKLGIYLQDKVFKECKMNNTLVNYQNITEIKNRVFGYKINEKTIKKCDQSFTSATIGDGGIYSTIDDLKKWIKYLRKNKKILNYMLNDAVVSDKKENYYGYGLRIRKINHKEKVYNIIYHCGSTIGTNTIMGFVKEMDVEFIFYSNQDGVDTDVLLDQIIERNIKNN